MNFEVLVQQQKSFFENQNTASIPYRLEQLKKLKDLIIKHEEDLYEAVYKDFKKSKFDTYTTEISFVIHEINFYLKILILFPCQLSARALDIISEAFSYGRVYLIFQKKTFEFFNFVFGRRF